MITLLSKSDGFVRRCKKPLTYEVYLNRGVFFTYQYHDFLNFNYKLEAKNILFILSKLISDVFMIILNDAMAHKVKIRIMGIELN